MSKLTMVAAFGAGYVLGARAGRERYKEIAGRARTVWENPTVQEKTAKVQEKAQQQASKAAGAAKERLPVGDRGGTHSRDAAGDNDSSGDSAADVSDLGTVRTDGGDR